jgi:molecular chaperone DnaK (HSP70)
LVLDIGAGTTDVAGFVGVNNPDNDRMRVFEVIPAADAMNLAGNALDQALLKYIIDQSGLSADSTEGHETSDHIRRDIRDHKETLFRTGRVVVPINTGHVITVELSDFLAFAPVKEFGKRITEMVAKSAHALAGGQSRVKLVATGGGAALPLVAEIAKSGVRHEGKFVGFSLIDAMSEDVRQTNPDLIDFYPQIAVALGGSLPNLPEQRVSISEGLTDAPKHKIKALYKN